MSSRMLRALVLIVTTGFTVAGCALSPQTVPVEPTLAVDEVDVGHGRRPESFEVAEDEHLQGRLRVAGAPLVGGGDVRGPPAERRPA